MIVLGIDPSTTDTGWAVLEASGAALCLSGYGSIRSKSKMSKQEKIGLMYEGLKEVIINYRPALISVEAQHINRFRPSAVIPLSRVRGIIELLAYQFKIPIEEWAPATVKLQFTGHGHAKKEDMLRQVEDQFGVKTKNDNIADAIGMAVTAIKKLKEGEI